jgi:hypothetical protein
MALQSSGPLKISEIESEFGGIPPTSISEYYRSGLYVTNIAENETIPESGIISFSNFYGTVNLIPLNTYSVVRGTTAELACSSSTTFTVYQQSTQFNLNQPIYRNSEGTQLAVAGWYKATLEEFIYVRQWTGSDWTDSATVCTF